LRWFSAILTFPFAYCILSKSAILALMRPADRAYDEVLPLLRVVTRKLKDFHLSEDERTQLAVLVASYFFGNAGSLMNEDRLVGARRVADLIVGAIRSEKPMRKRLKVVHNEIKDSEAPSDPSPEAKGGK
jgi:hypothetical protein